MAEAYDDGQRHDFWDDERRNHVFDRLYYSPERREWLARFKNLLPNELNPYTDWTHGELVMGVRACNMMNVKPSQMYRGLAAFSAHIDRETAKLNFLDSSPA